MKEMMKRHGDKLLFLLIAVLILGWMLIDFTQKETLEKQMNLDGEMDLISAHMNQLVESNRMILEVASSRLVKDVLAVDRENDLRQLLTFTVDRVTYNFGLYLKPDRIINGFDQINPSELINQGEKKYGEVVYFGEPFFDGERKKLIMPIYMTLNDKKIGTEGIIYTQIDAGNLISDFNRMDSKMEGQSFLVNNQGKAINLSLGKSLMTAEASLMNQLIAEDKLSSPMRLISGDYQVISRSINSTGWKMVYIEEKSSFFNSEYMNLVVMFALIIGIVLIHLLDTLKLINRDKTELPKEKLLEHTEKHEETSPSFVWLKNESNQVKKLRLTNYSDEVLQFKIQYCLDLLGDMPTEDYTFSSKKFLKWSQRHFEAQFARLQIEEYSGNLEMGMTADLVQAAIDLVYCLADSGLRGSVQFKSDPENQMLLFSLFGDISKVVGKMSTFKNQIEIYEGSDRYIRFAEIGNRIILSVSSGKKAVKAEIKSSLSESDLPQLVYFYENEAEQNAILKYYLDHIKMPYETINSLKAVPMHSVVMMTESIYNGLIEVNSIGFEMPYRFIVCGNQENITSDDVIVVSRPYAIEKLEYALKRAAVMDIL